MLSIGQERTVIVKNTGKNILNKENKMRELLLVVTLLFIVMTLINFQANKKIPKDHADEVATDGQFFNSIGPDA